MIEKPYENGSVTSLTESRRKIAATNLKACPLCDSLNASSNEECFVCRWHGEFSRDPSVIERGLMRLLDRCPDYNFSTPLEARKKATLTSLLRKFFRKRLDLRV